MLHNLKKERKENFTKQNRMQKLFPNLNNGQSCWDARRSRDSIFFLFFFFLSYCFLFLFSTFSPFLFFFFCYFPLLPSHLFCLPPLIVSHFHNFIHTHFHTEIFPFTFPSFIHHSLSFSSPSLLLTVFPLLPFHSFIFFYNDFFFFLSFYASTSLTPFSV